MRKHIHIIAFLSLLLSVSCGTYKRIKTETDFKKEVKENTTKQKDQTILENEETLTEVKGDSLYGKFILPSSLSKDELYLTANSDGSSLQIWLTNEYLKYLLTNKKKQTTSKKKTTKTVDKGKEQNNIDTSIGLNNKADTAQKPWQPPWYLSGVLMLALYILYKVFTSKFQIIKKQ